MPSNPLDPATLRAVLQEVGHRVSQAHGWEVNGKINALENVAQWLEQRLAEAAAPRPMAAQDCADDVCQASKRDGILCAEGECDYHSGVRKPGPPPAGAQENPQPDSAEWWRQVAQGLGVEIARLKAERDEAWSRAEAVVAQMEDRDDLLDHTPGLLQRDDVIAALLTAKRMIHEGRGAELDACLRRKGPVKSDL